MVLWYGNDIFAQSLPYTQDDIYIYTYICTLTIRVFMHIYLHMYTGWRIYADLFIFASLLKECCDLFPNDTLGIGICVLSASLKFVKCNVTQNLSTHRNWLMLVLFRSVFCFGELGGIHICESWHRHGPVFRKRSPLGDFSCFPKKYHDSWHQSSSQFGFDVDHTQQKRVDCLLLIAFWYWIT